MSITLLSISDANKGCHDTLSQVAAAARGGLSLNATAISGILAQGVHHACHPFCARLAAGAAPPFPARQSHPGIAASAH